MGCLPREPGAQAARSLDKAYNFDFTSENGFTAIMLSSMSAALHQLGLVVVGMGKP